MFGCSRIHFDPSRLEPTLRQSVVPDQSVEPGQSVVSNRSVVPDALAERTPERLSAPNSGRAGPRHYKPGDRLSERYRLERRLGYGGMGTVWRAYDETLQIGVAVKFIGFDASEDSMRRRLLNEARASARVQHPAIVRVFNFGETREGQAFIVMEALEGEDLARRIGGHARLPATHAVALLLPAIGAIAAAHAAGVVHRDIKPSNIFLTSADGERISPKVLDFGIATVRDRSDDVRLTHPGTVMGSPGYMAPEQASGAIDIDERADVWALSVVLYEMVTGALPFVAPNSQAMLAAVVSDAPLPLTRTLPGERELWRIVRRGLEKNRARRWPSARALGDALARWAMERGVVVDSTGASLAAVWRRATRRREGPAQQRSIGLLLPSTQPIRARAPTHIDDTIAQMAYQRNGRWRAPSWISVGALTVSLALAAGVHRSSWGSGDVTSPDAVSAELEAPPTAAYLAGLAPQLHSPTESAAGSDTVSPTDERGPTDAAACACSVARVADRPDPASPSSVPRSGGEELLREGTRDLALPAREPF